MALTKLEQEELEILERKYGNSSLENGRPELETRDPFKTPDDSESSGLTDDEKDEYDVLQKKYDLEGYKQSKDKEDKKRDEEQEKITSERSKRFQEENDKDHLLHKGLKAIEILGSWYDSLGSSSSRKFVSDLQDGKGVMDSAKDASGFLLNPKSSHDAPTGTDIAKKAGVSTRPFYDMLPNPSDDADEEIKKKIKGIEIKENESEKEGTSLADVAGFGFDMALDPLAAIPIRSTMKAAGKALGYATEKTLLKAPAKLTDMAMGTKTATKAVDNTLETVKKVFHPNQRPEWPSLNAIAEKHGVDIENLSKSVEFPEESIIARGSRTQAEGILGAENLRKFQEGIEQINTGLKKSIQKISKGPVLSPGGAGQLIRHGIQEKFTSILGADSITHNNIIKKYKGLKLDSEAIGKIESKLKGVERFAIGRIKRGAIPKQAKEADKLLYSIEKARSTNGSYKQYYEMLDALGEVAFAEKNKLDKIPFYQDKLQEIYFAVRNNMIASLEFQKGKGVADQLRNTNAQLAKYLRNRKILRVAGNERVADEKVFQKLLLNGDSITVKALKESLEPDQFNKLKSAFLEEIRAAKSNSEDIVGLRSLYSELKRKKNISNHLLSPEDMKEVNELMELGFYMGERKMSSSGTSAGNVFKDIAGGIKTAIVNETFIENLAEAARARSNKTSDEIKGLVKEFIKGNDLAGRRVEYEFTKKAFLDSLKEGRKILNRETGINAFLKAPQQYSIQKEEEKRNNLKIRSR